ncbi:MAG: putative GntR family transcriptional regulator [Ilumatobacteraceae bacterium]|nr:putative GntR family transcriptional regulator [Ilumatobacteraceae bacterium]
MSLTPAPNAADLAYHHVKEQIVLGSFAGGEMISEGDIAAQLSISRTPVREAFLRLQAEGWMRLYPKRGALVVAVTPDEIDDVLAARQLVEGNAAMIVADDAAGRPALLARLDECLARQDRCMAANDVTAYAEADADFHLAIVDAAGNSVLADFTRSLRERQRRMTARAVRRDPGALQTMTNEHRELRERIAAGDAAGFGSVLARHMDAAHRRALANR